MWGSFRSTPGYPSVKFHGKVDIGFGCKVLKDTSQVKWERIKGRGFKYNKFNFTVAVYDERRATRIWTEAGFRCALGLRT